MSASFSDVSNLTDAFNEVLAGAELALQDAIQSGDVSAENPEKLASERIYRELNAIRDWMNLNLLDFECYLEDVWNEHQPGETWFEYIVRSRHTLNDMPTYGYDVYANHQDAKGVWHLGAYQRSFWVKPPTDIFQEIAAFVQANLPPHYAEPFTQN